MVIRMYQSIYSMPDAAPISEIKERKVKPKKEYNKTTKNNKIMNTALQLCAYLW